jgi:hypothetical protein
MKIDFEFTTAHGLFRDALHLPDDHAFTDDEIQAMKQQRVDNWIAVVTAPSVEPDTVEIDGITYEKIQIDGQTVLKPVGA